MTKTKKPYVKPQAFSISIDYDFKLNAASGPDATASNLVNNETEVPGGNGTSPSSGGSGGIFTIEEDETANIGNH